MEKIPTTRQYPDQQLYKLFVRHAVSAANHAALSAGKDTARVGGRQPRIKLALHGYDQATAFAELARQQLPVLLDGTFAIAALTRSFAERARATAQTVRDTWGLTLPIRRNNDLAELHKGFRAFGGHQRCLRATVMDEAFYERRKIEDWDFRYGKPAYNRLGLHHLSFAETEREAGARVLRWINHKPAVPQSVVEADVPIVDVAFGHGMSGTRGIAMALHGNDAHDIDITVAEAEKRYKLPNASGFVLAPNRSDGWQELGRIILPEHQ